MQPHKEIAVGVLVFILLTAAMVNTALIVMSICKGFIDG